MAKSQLLVETCPENYKQAIYYMISCSTVLCKGLSKEIVQSFTIGAKPFRVRTLGMIQSDHWAHNMSLVSYGGRIHNQFFRSHS